MNPVIESTTDTKERILAAVGGVKPEEKVESEAAPEEKAETAETSEPSETEQEVKDEDESEQSEEKKPKKGFKKRIDKLTKKNAELEKKLAFLEGRVTAEKPVEAKVEAQPEGKPTPDKYATHEEFLEALTDWKVDQREKAKEAKSQEEKAKSEILSKVDVYTKGVEQVQEKFDDWEDVMDGVNHIAPSLAVQQLLLESENGPELAYHLAKDPKEFARINALSPVAAAREFGKFEVKHQSAQKESKETKTTKAPAPIKPVGSKASAVTKDPEDMDFREFKKWRESQKA